jgi:NAD(P)H-dependent FMN reductase
VKITIISASTRAGSASLRVAEYIQAQYAAQQIEANILDLNTSRLPLYDDSESGPWQEVWRPMSEQLAAADGYVFVSPEWNGTTGPGLINLMLYAGTELAHKPVMLVGVSSGRGGTYPLADMRLMGYKNRHYVIIPENAIVQHVEETLVDGQMTDGWVRDRLQYGTTVLVEYAKALAQVRQSGVLDLVKFKNGV